MSFDSQQLSIIFASREFRALPSNRVLSALAQIHEHYIVGTKNIILDDIRVGPSGFSFILSSENKLVQGVLVWNVWEEPPTKAWVTPRFDRTEHFDVARAVSAGNSMSRVASTLVYMRSVAMNLDDLTDCRAEARAAHEAWHKLTAVRYPALTESKPREPRAGQPNDPSRLQLMNGGEE